MKSMFGSSVTSASNIMSITITMSRDPHTRDPWPAQVPMTP